MHLSRRQRLVKEGDAPQAEPHQAPRRGRTVRPAGEVATAATAAGVKAENRPKRFRVRNPSFSSSTAEERKVGVGVGAPPNNSSTTATGSVGDSCVALPSSRRLSGSRPAGPPAERSSVSRSGSLPSLPASPRIARNRTFVFMYDEDERKSRAVRQPDDLNIGLPVLVQYDLTEEDSNWKSPLSPHQEGEDLLGANYSSPTVELLQKWDKNEKRNKGMHVMKWLVQVQN